MNYPITQTHAILETIASQLSSLEQQVSLSKTWKQPGNLRVDSNGGHPQYYHMTKKGDTYGIYIPKSDTKLISALAQKDYHEKCLRFIKQQQKLLTRFTKSFHPEDISAIHSNLKPARRNFVESILLTDDEFALQWQAVSYTGKNFSSDIPVHLTAKGERVRSKSEVIIADSLMRLGVPYHYEAPLKLSISESNTTTEIPTKNIRRKAPTKNAASTQNLSTTERLAPQKFRNNQSVRKGILATSRTVTFHPDFTCLNKRTRQVFVWEHFGMMDNPDYANNAVEKERLYAAAGYIPGVNFITSTETTDLPLNSKYVEQIARKLLL